MKRLKDLFDFKIPEAIGELCVSAVCDNSKNVIPGSIFVVLGGSLVNGKNYINEAILNGARCIVLDDEISDNHVEIKDNVVFVFVKSAHLELAHIAHKFYDSNLDHIVAVTGTNGKSSTIDIIRQIWLYSTINAASIGTLGIVTKNGHRALAKNLTSPGTIDLHKIFNALCDSGVKNVVLEASSHGIIQHRMDGIKFSVCAFTNFTQDHLDYHKTLKNYWQAKERLFLDLATSSTIFVANEDDPCSKKIFEIAKNRKIKYIGYGRTSNDVKIINITHDESCQRVDALFLGEKISFALPLLGEFQVYNALCAAVSCYFTGIKIEDIVVALAKIQSINGRLELIARTKSANIYLDYAHAEDALKNAILAVRNYTKNRVITVFGCGGDRDQQKRVMMGKIAEKLSDIVIVTDDNPRNEDPQLIRTMILSGCSSAIEIADRREAIEFAMGMLNAGDSLLIAGKGHETYQQIKNEFVYCNDKEIVLNKVSQ